MVTEEYKISQEKNIYKIFSRRNYISLIFIAKKIKHSMRNDILKVIKEQNWGALENFGFEGKKW